jgi:DNA (cytosine-5)-methyltransferase 1
MKHGSLFNGMGGFQLAAEWMGWENIMSCEIDDFCNKVTGFYWPNCIQHGDIKKTDFTIYRGKIDVLTGGFPCQPYSFAGSRKGKEDDRHLWPEMRRAIQSIQPAWVIGENVRGIVSWNNGLVFDEVQTEMEAEGYEVTPFEIPACGIGADHIRERVWFIAHSRSLGWKNVQSNNASGINTTSYTKRNWAKGTQRNQETNVLDSSSNTFLRFQEMYGQSAIFDVDDGLPFRLDGITVPKWIESSSKAAGNAIHPGVVYEIFKAIKSVNLK